MGAFDIPFGPRAYTLKHVAVRRVQARDAHSPGGRTAKIDNFIIVEARRGGRVNHDECEKRERPSRHGTASLKRWVRPSINVPTDVYRYTGYRRRLKFCIFFVVYS